MQKIVIICLLATLTGCKSLGEVIDDTITSTMTFFTGTTTISTSHTKPAEYDFSKYGAVSVSKVTVSGSGNRHNLADKLRNALHEKLYSSKYFETYSADRKVLKPYFELATDITRADLNEHNSSSEGTCGGEKCYLYTTSAEWNANALVSTYDGKTGKLLWQKKFTETKNENKMQQGGYAQFDKAWGFSEVMTNLAKQINDSIQPQIVRVSAKLFENDELPGMTEGIKYAKSRNWNRAAESFKTSVDAVARKKYAGDVSSQAYYNYGIILAYGVNDYNAAIQMIEKAIALENDDDYIEAISNINMLKTDAEKLAAQNYKVL